MRQFRRMGTVPDLADVKQALSRLRREPEQRFPEGRRAAVAAVLRSGATDLELLFILRAKHARDPWSGQMAWPGGRIETGDASPLAAAVREAREEVALDLERDAELLGQLSEVRTHLRHGPGPLSVVPFLFHLRGEATPVPNSEVQEALWVPVDFFRDRAHRGRLVWLGRGVPLAMPCYRYNGRVIWGLTLRMLEEVLRLFAGGPAK